MEDFHLKQLNAIIEDGMVEMFNGNAKQKCQKNTNLEKLRSHVKDMIIQMIHIFWLALAGYVMNWTIAQKELTNLHTTHCNPLQCLPGSLSRKSFPLLLLPS